MSAPPTPAPIYRDALNLTTWLVGRFDGHANVLERRLCGGALALLESVVLALSGRDRAAHLADADDHLMVLRTLLRVALECERLSERQWLHASELTDSIGRQLGGWRRRLAA